MTVSYLGYNTPGASFFAPGINQVLLQQVTPATSGALLAVGVYCKIDTADHSIGLAVGVLSDNAGAPDLIQAIAFNATSTLLLERQLGTPVARWLDLPLGLSVVGGTPYWLAVMHTGAAVANALLVAHDGGTDRTYTSGGNWLADAGTIYAVTTTTRKHSIRGLLVS